MWLWCNSTTAYKYQIIMVFLDLTCIPVRVSKFWQLTSVVWHPGNLFSLAQNHGLMVGQMACLSASQALASCWCWRGAVWPHTKVHVHCSTKCSVMSKLFLPLCTVYVFRYLLQTSLFRVRVYFTFHSIELGSPQQFTYLPPVWDT